MFILRDTAIAMSFILTLRPLFCVQAIIIIFLRQIQWEFYFVNKFVISSKREIIYIRNEWSEMVNKQSNIIIVFGAINRNQLITFRPES